MIIHEFVNGEKPIMVLIHGVLTPWQVWTPHVDLFKDCRLVHGQGYRKYCEFGLLRGAEVVCFKGDAHCYKAIFQPKKWAEVVGGFLQKQ